MKSIKVEKEITIDSVRDKISLAGWAILGIASTECVPSDNSFENIVFLLDEADRDLEALTKGGGR